MAQDRYTESYERKRRGGGAYDTRPGREGLPNAQDMDRPRAGCSTYDRTGERKDSIPRGIRTIQDQNGNGGRR